MNALHSSYSASHSALKKRIMRRVYYAYALRLALHPRTVYVTLALALLFVFTSFVSVSAVLYNLSFVQVYNVDAFIYSAFAHTEIWTVLAMGGLVVVGFLFMRSLGRRYTPRHVRYMNFA